MFEGNSASSGRKSQILALQEYRELFATVASDEDVTLFEQQLTQGHTLQAIKLLRRYADKLDI